MQKRERRTKGQFMRTHTLCIHKILFVPRQHIEVAPF